MKLGEIPDTLLETMAAAYETGPYHAFKRDIMMKRALAAAEVLGFRLVPRKATKPMVKAAAKAMSPAHRPTPRRVSVAAKHAYRWRAMVDAAPKVTP